MDIQSVMMQYIDLSGCKPRYTPQTGLKEKTDKISLLSMLLDSGDKEMRRC